MNEREFDDKIKNLLIKYIQSEKESVVMYFSFRSSSNTGTVHWLIQIGLLESHFLGCKRHHLNRSFNKSR